MIRGKISCMKFVSVLFEGDSSQFILGNRAGRHDWTDFSRRKDSNLPRKTGSALEPILIRRALRCAMDFKRLTSRLFKRMRTCIRGESRLYPTMLEGLDAIDWSSLTHAYGSASDVPGLLRAWASDQPEAAREAQGALFGNIYHQGTVYEATAPAVPFLIDLLARPKTCERVGLVALLASIAEGMSFLEVHGDLPHYIHDMEKPEMKDRLAHEMQWKAQAREAVQLGAPEYWGLLLDPTTRVAIPYLLSQLPGEAMRICSAAPSMIDLESEDLFDASMLLCWAGAASPGVETAEVFRPFLQNGKTPLIRLCGALGTLRLGDEVPRMDVALGIYFDALRETSRYEVKDDAWLWGLGDIWSMLFEWLPLFSRPAREALVQQLPSGLPTLEDYTAANLAADNLEWAFDIDHLPKSVGKLTPLQLALLQGLVRFTNISYTSHPLISGIHASLGIPADLKRLKALLG
jgi:hypothetical protein